MTWDELVDYAKKLMRAGCEIKEILMSTKMLKRALMKDIIATQTIHIHKSRRRQDSSKGVNKGLTLWASLRKAPAGWDSEKLQFVSLSYRQGYVLTGEKAIKRQKIIEEIVDTEAAYLKGLGILVKDFNLKFVNRFAIMLLEFHSVLWVDLRQSSNIAEVFEKNADYLKMGNPYVQGYSEMMEKIVALRKKRKFQKKLVQLQVRGITDITNYLITPVQRVPRYQLLLKDLLKWTPKNHPQYNGLHRALERIKAVAITLNEAGRRIEEINTLYKLGTKIIGTSTPVFQTGRVFIDEDRFNERVGTPSTAHNVFLFSDVLLLTVKKYSGEVYHCYTEFKMEYIVRVTRMTAVIGKEKSTCSNCYRWGLQIWCKVRGSHFLFFKTSQIRDKWVDLIDKYRVVTSVRRKMTTQSDGKVLLGNEEQLDDEKKGQDYSTIPNQKKLSKCDFIGVGKEARLVGISPWYAQSDGDVLTRLLSGPSTPPEKSSLPASVKSDIVIIQRLKNTADEVPARAKSEGHTPRAKLEGGLSNLIREEFF